MTQHGFGKNRKLKWLAFALVALLVVSCTVQRRHYLPGVYSDLRPFAHDQGFLHSTPADTMDADPSLRAFEAGIAGDQPKMKPIDPNPGKNPGERIAVLEEKANAAHSFPAITEPPRTIPAAAKNDIQKKQDLISACKEERSGDQYFYLIASAMMASALLIIAAFRKFFLNITRWAKENPKKTRVLITTTGFTMMGLALYSGYNFKQMGYNVSGSTSWISTIIMALGFLFVPFRVKRDTVAHPKTVNRRRLAHAGIIASSFVLVMAYGNRMEEQHPNSPVTKFITAIDNTAFPDHVKENVEDEDQNPQIQRASAGAGVILAAVLLFILLLVTLCASVCLIIFAVAGAFSAGITILAVLGGLAGSALSIFGMVSVVKWTQKKDRESQNRNRLDNID
jgi:hypothetical protein